MSIPTTRTCTVAGTPFSSGSVQTGELVVVNGGGRAACIYSGSLSGIGIGGAPGAVVNGNDIFFYSGAGRLTSVQPHIGVQSGQPIIFYDTALAASGGPIPTSGHILIAKVPFTNEQLSAQAVGGLSSVAPIFMNAVFQSGLACRIASGAPGFTIFFQVEVDSNFPNA